MVDSARKPTKITIPLPSRWSAITMGTASERGNDFHLPLGRPGFEVFPSLHYRAERVVGAR